MTDIITLSTQIQSNLTRKDPSPRPFDLVGGRFRSDSPEYNIPLVSGIIAFISIIIIIISIVYIVVSSTGEKGTDDKKEESHSITSLAIFGLVAGLIIFIIASIYLALSLYVNKKFPAV